jgi:Sensors of blue-light using FAD
MLQIIYSSASTKPYTHKELVELLKVARKKNMAVGVTGMLLYHGGCFLQVLEGPDENVEALYAKIQKDPRHTNFLLLVRETIEEKAFEDWSMGFVDTTHIAESIGGFVDYMQALQSMTLDKTRARILLKRFQEGSYRRSANR